MFLKAGAVSLALLLASRLIGLLRESAQAAAFGTSGLADVAVLMLTLPDWLAGLVASGALAYAMVPAWAGQTPDQVRASQRRVARWLLAGGLVLAVALIALRSTAVGWFAGGLPTPLRPLAATALVWSGLALPAALLAALWATRLQHERDFLGLYAANLVVNLALIAAIGSVALQSGPEGAVLWLGAGLLAAMALRLAWLGYRQKRIATPTAQDLPTQAFAMPAARLWLWAALSAGLPLALPFAARSIASQSGEGGLATFNYAWKLVELPLVLAIQLVATLAFPAIARAFAHRANLPQHEMAALIRTAFALAWTLACAAAAALLVGAPALTSVLFGWGRMDPTALIRVAQWGAAGAWGLLPQALIAVCLTVLAAQNRLFRPVGAYTLALAALLAMGTWGPQDGASIMGFLNGLLVCVACVSLVAMGPMWRKWIPWRSCAVPLLVLLGIAVLARQGLGHNSHVVTGLVWMVLAVVSVTVASLAASTELRAAFRR